MPFVYVAIFLQGQNGFIKIVVKYSVRIFLLSTYILLVNNVLLLFNDQMAFFFFLILDVRIYFMYLMPLNCRLKNS